MGLREFIDERGVRWMVWDVTTDSLHPVTRGEDYLREFTGGWLCFESALGEKRRLTDHPVGWEELSDEQLQLLRERATSQLRRDDSESTDDYGHRAAAMERIEFEERRRRDVAPPLNHPRRRREDREPS